MKEHEALRILCTRRFAHEKKCQECQIRYEKHDNEPFHRAILAHGILELMLAQQIRTDMITAMKAKDDLKVQTLRGALAAFTNELVAKGKKPTEVIADADAIVVLKRLGKQRKEAADVYAKGGRAELAEKELSELKIIEGYLPQGVSREEIEKVARAKKEELGVTDASGAGKLTGAVMKALAGSADGNLVKEVVQKLLF